MFWRNSIHGKNDISIRPAKRQIVIGSDICTYGSESNSTSGHSIRRAHVLRVSTSTTVWPGDFVEVELPKETEVCDATFAIEPHYSDKDQHRLASLWPHARNVLYGPMNLKLPLQKLNSHYLRIDL